MHRSLSDQVKCVPWNERRRLALDLRDHLLQLVRSDENLLTMARYRARAKVGATQRSRRARQALDDDGDPEDEEQRNWIRDLATMGEF